MRGHGKRGRNWLGLLAMAGAMLGGGCHSGVEPVERGVARVELQGVAGRVWSRADRSVLSVGVLHSLAVSGDGSVWAWGANGTGQLGTGTFQPEPQPVRVPGLTGVVAVAAGWDHTLALREDGTVWAWGTNWTGQLGDGTTEPMRATPGPVAGLTGVVALATGYGHSLALRADGTVWAWGGNWLSQLGQTPSNEPVTTPVRVEGLSDVVAIAASSSRDYSLVLRADGTVWGWGSNGSGALGQAPSFEPVTTPVRVEGLSDVVAIDAGAGFSLALRADGTVWAWGSNASGEHGDLVAPWRSTPVQVPEVTDVVALRAGDFHVLAQRRDGTVWAWGSNQEGQLGDGTRSARRGPAPVEGLHHVAVFGARLGSLALLRDGTLRAWGTSFVGQLGFTPDTRPSPVPVAHLTQALSAATGTEHSLAVRADGTLWAWGNNGYGQLGDGQQDHRNAPVQVRGLTDVVGAIGGAYHSGALRADGTVWTWGANWSGQLGDETTSFRTEAAPVPGLTGVKALAGGAQHTLALRQDGTLWAWGSNGRGQLGIGPTPYSRSTPTQVSALTGVVGIAANDAHSLAVLADGSVWGWGNSTDNWGWPRTRTVPQRVPGLSGVVAVAAGAHRFFALREDGTVWSWALALVNGMPTPTPPAAVPGLSDVVRVVGGRSHALALRADGTVWTWGGNALGELGYPVVSGEQPTPQQVPGLSEVVSISASGNHNVVVRADGSTWAWGSNSLGQVGDGTSWQLSTPTEAPLPCRFTALPSVGHEAPVERPCLARP